MAETQSHLYWLQQTWSYTEISDPAGTPQYDFMPSNVYVASDFAAFFSEFSADPEFQLTNTSWPLQVFHIDPEEPGLHVEKTVYYAKPETYDGVTRTLFPLETERTRAELTYTVSLTGARQGPQAAVILRGDEADGMLYVYVFQWHEGWYLLEISDLTGAAGVHGGLSP